MRDYDDDIFLDEAAELPFAPYSPERKEDPIKKQSSTVSSTPDRDHGKVWEEDVKLPKRKRKQVLNPWE